MRCSTIVDEGCISALDNALQHTSTQYTLIGAEYSRWLALLVRIERGASLRARPHRRTMQSALVLAAVPLSANGLPLTGQIAYLYSLLRLICTVSNGKEHLYE